MHANETIPIESSDRRLLKPWERKYTIERTDILAATSELRVLHLTLLPEQEVPWHRHPANADLFIGLTGRFTVYTQNFPSQPMEPAQHFNVPAMEPHRVVNESDSPCTFLVIQGVGRYDYIAMRDARN